MPSTATYRQQQEFQTQIISVLISEYTSGIGSTWGAVSKGPHDSNFTRFIGNGVIFAVKVVDKLWQGKRECEALIYALCMCIQSH